MTTPERKKVISSGWSAAGFSNALKNGKTCLETLDPFADINPLVSEMLNKMKVICSKSTKVLFNICLPKIKRIPATRSRSLKIEMFLML